MEVSGEQPAERAEPRHALPAVPVSSPVKKMKFFWRNVKFFWRKDEGILVET